ncbi:hypothetical protein [Mammaliicoccus sciuri]|uniref:hypothetical protein n=1 Tax=Mammaliicoccus sciuri TaxID=1296 RepID=UPI001E2BA9A7|nr:hypothetical protein [Mammaliicoccus sciuri]MCD8898493.1 hypothetical protein [Mammaliicoccus sciuri]
MKNSNKILNMVSIIIILTALSLTAFMHSDESLNEKEKIELKIEKKYYLAQGE